MKTVLVTGASRGIGAACALEFAKIGYFVVINYFKSKKQAIDLMTKIKKHSGSAMVVYGDVSKEIDVEKIYLKLKKRDCLPEILINNTGVALQKLLTDTTLNEWNYVFKTNVSSMFLCCKKFLPNMIKNKFGKIVNISSIWGLAGASCEVAYSASKAAVVGFTKALAKEVAPSNVFVNCVAPGVVETEMNRNLNNHDLVCLKEKILLGRFASAQDVAKVVVFLASEQASYITGQTIGVDGCFIG